MGSVMDVLDKTFEVWFDAFFSDIPNLDPQLKEAFRVVAMNAYLDGAKHGVRIFQAETLMSLGEK